MTATSTPETRLGTEPEVESGDTAGIVTRNAGLLAIGTIVARLSTFALAIVMTRALGPSSYGQYGYAGALATVVVPIADVGLTSWIVREVARSREQTERNMRRLLTLKTVMTLLVLVGVTVPAFLTARGFEVAAVILLVLLANLADDWAQFVFGYFRGREAMGFESGVTAISALARTVGGIAIAVTTHRLIAVVIWMLLTSGAQAAWAGRRLREALRERPWARLKEKLPPLDWRGIAAMSLIGFFATIYLRADSVIIGSIYDDRTVGYYTSAYALVGGLQILPWMIAVAATPVFARSFEGTDDLFDASWQETLRVVLVLALPFALVTCLLADPIVHLLFGGRFGPAGPALAILVWSSPLWALNMLLAGLLRGAGRTLSLTAVTGFGALLNIGLNIWAVHEFGINGAATVTVATEGAVLIVLVAIAIRQGVVRKPRLPLAGLMLGLAALSAVAVVGRSWPVILTALLALAAYLVVVRLTRVITDRDVATVRRVVGRGG